jgi:CRP-like cAMP-binding protein
MRKVLYVLGQLDDLDAQWLARVGRKRRVADGEAILRQDVASPSLFLLIEGELAVDVAGVGRVAVLQSGEILGEMSFVENALPSATVVGLGPAIVLDVPKDALHEKIEADTGFGVRFYRAIAMFLSDRLRSSQQRKATGGKVSLDNSAHSQTDELEEGLLDTVSLAGDRFDRLLRTLAAARG